jgi:hypothetical protein
MLYRIISARGVLRLHPRRLTLEPLESRELFSIAPDAEQSLNEMLSHGGGCSCPICAGTIAFAPEMRAPASAAEATKNALSALPQLNSLPGARATLFLDFNGSTTSGWESYAVTTPVYDYDGDRSTFSNGELNSIREIWARVAEDYAPFDINVTTVDPGNLTNNLTAKVAIGGNWSDWFGSSAGGVAYVGGFSNSASNVGFVFTDALGNGTARYVAEATSHEAGHLFGLWHQASYNSSGQMTSEYSSGNSQWAPIMGVGYYSAVTTWYNGPSNLGRTSLQDDMSIISGSQNGFGYRTDEAGDNTSTAAILTVAGTTISGSGVIGRNNDQDFYRFSTSGGSVSIVASGIGTGADLDVVLELRRADGSLVTTANPTSSLGASIATTLSAGDYYLVVRSTGVYGYVGQYTLAGALPAGSTGGGGGSTGGGGSGSGGGGDSITSAPEIAVTVNGTAIADNTGQVNYGTTAKGVPVTKTYTVTNEGNAPLILSQLTSKSIPKNGYTLVSGFGSLTLAAGQSTTFTIALKAKSKGTDSGTVLFGTNDTDERTFNFYVVGVVNKTGVVGGKGSIFDNATEFNASTTQLDLATGVSLAERAGNLGSPLALGGTIDAARDEALSAVSASSVSVARPLDSPTDFAPTNRWSSGATTDAEIEAHDDQFADIDELLIAVGSDDA